MKSILVTGGAGFMGSNFIRFLLQEDPEIRVMNVDALTYAGNPENLSTELKKREVGARLRRSIEEIMWKS